MADANAVERFKLACDLDRRGREAEAIGEYRAALEMGLRGELRQKAFVGLGSSLRMVGEVAESVEVLRAAIREFPEDAALQAFLALSLCSSGQDRKAATILLGVIVEHVPLGGYERALAAYQAELEDR